MKRCLPIVVLAAAINAGCDRPSPMDLPAPHADLVDGAHGGRPGFYFLPPLAPAPVPTGTFDASHLENLDVEACAATCVELAGLRVETGDEPHYHLNWKTKGLPAGDYRIRVTLGEIELGYVDVEVRNGRTIPIKFWIDDTLVLPPPVVATCALPLPSTNAPAANAITFVSNRDGNDEIYVMRADGTVQTRLTNDPAMDTWPTWSPDYRMIAFASNRNGNWEIYTMNADGSGLHRVTTAALASSPRWAPDGRISYLSSRTGNAEIVVCNHDGSETNLTNAPASDEHWHAWSPDGSRIVFASTRAGPAQLFLMDADGSNVSRLTNTTTHALHPSFSPDGTRVVFAVYEPADVWLINVDGSGLTQLTTHSANDGEPAWSPDGAKIAFRSSRAGGSQIWTMNGDGSGPAQLTFAGANGGPGWARR